MFSIRMQEQTQPIAATATISQRLFGKLLGFTAGLVLILFADSLFSDHAIWRSVFWGLAQSDRAVGDAIGDLSVSLAGR